MSSINFARAPKVVWSICVTEIFPLIYMKDKIGFILNWGRLFPMKDRSKGLKLLFYLRNVGPYTSTYIGRGPNR